MGLFDRLTGKAKPPPPSPAPQPPAAEDTADAPTPAPAPAGNIMPRLVDARLKLEAQDLAGAVAIYEEVLASAGERADVLVTISGDLGSNGHLREIIELVAPRYDADRHGPATGLNVLQAYLALRQAEAAQHVLDILFALNRTDLEERLHGFSNALAELITAGRQPPESAPAGGAGEAGAVEPPKINIVSISKPIWHYGLESVPGILPAKGDRLRRVAFAQLALPGLPEIETLAGKPEEELGRLSRALPLWLAETFYFSPHYAPFTAVGVRGQPGQPGHHALFPAEWTTDNLRQVVATTEGGLDYVFTGALRQRDGDYEVVLRVWEVRKFRERKQFTAHWTPATADAELAALHGQIRQFMEWTPDASALAYAAPAAPRMWLETLGAGATLFLADKGLLAREQVPDLAGVFTTAGAQAAAGEAAALAYLTLCDRAHRLELPLVPAAVPLFDSPLVDRARAALA
jgi:hypothetical protein